MFMDDSLNIDPSVLNTTMDDQMNLFSMEHENKYGELMNELIEIFIPPEGATGEELENAKRDMQKYSDYRTYLSFDMEQIVDGDEKLTIGLSKMIKKTLVEKDRTHYMLHYSQVLHRPMEFIFHQKYEEIQASVWLS